MTMNGHDEMLESVALLALGVLPESQARSVADHARTCEQCSREYAELRVAGDAVGYAAELRAGELDEVTAARMKSRVMRAVAAVAPPSEARELPSWPPPAERRRPAWIPYGAAAAAVLLAVVTSVNNVALRKQLDDQAAAASRATAFQTRIAAALGPDSKFYAVPAGEVVISRDRVYLALPDLPPPASGKVYQAWTLSRGAHAMTPSVTFTPADGVTLVELPQPAAGLEEVAVSVEPAGGSKAPTSTPTFVRKFS